MAASTLRWALCIVLSSASLAAAQSVYQMHNTQARCRLCALAPEHAVNDSPLQSSSTANRSASTCPVRAHAAYAHRDCAHMSPVWQARPVHHLTCGGLIHLRVTPDPQHQHTLARKGLCPGGCAAAVGWSCLGGEKLRRYARTVTRPCDCSAGALRGWRIPQRRPHRRGH